MIFQITKEHTMGIRKINVFLLMLITVSLVLASCASTEAEAPAAEAVPAADITPLGEDEVVDGLFSIKDLDVASYRIRGEGPDGAYFDWVEAESPKIALADIRRGEWTLYAQGLNADGEPVIQGQMTTFLSEDSPVDNLVFDESYGTGSVRCALAWNTAQVQHPHIDVYVKADDGEYTPRDADEVVYGNGTAIWSADDLPSGSYVARFILSDRSTPISGAAAALRVIDDKTSIGQVRLTIGDLSHVYGITLDNLPAETINGAISVDDHGAAFDTDSTEKILYDWYIDGEYMGTENGHRTVNLEGLDKGYHRVDVIARTADYGSINGDSIHIYTDGERISEISEDEINAVVEEFEPTAENEAVLRAAAAETTETEAVAIAEAETAAEEAAPEPAAVVVDITAGGEAGLDA